MNCLNTLAKSGNIITKAADEVAKKVKHKFLYNRDNNSSQYPLKKKKQRKLQIFGGRDNNEVESFCDIIQARIILHFFDFIEQIVHLVKFLFDYLCCLKFLCKILRKCEKSLSSDRLQIKKQSTPSHVEQESTSSNDITFSSTCTPSSQKEIPKEWEYEQMIDNLKKSMSMYDDHPNTLVLDLDETLIYCGDKALNQDAQLISFYFPEGYKSFYLHQRSHLQEFLEESAQLFNIYIFTASTKEYAEEILKFIDPQALIKKIYSRSSCFFDGKSLNKDLNSIHLDLNKTVMIDNSIACVLNNQENCLKIKDFTGDSKDIELITFSKLLKEMSISTLTFPQFIKQYNSQ